MLHITMVDIWRPFRNTEFYNPVSFLFNALLHSALVCQVHQLHKHIKD